MAARFERNIRGTAPSGLARASKCLYLGVRLTRSPMISATDDAPASHDHAANGRIGRSMPEPLRCELAGLAHPPLVGRLGAATGHGD
jgi:hypothetical protein